MMVWWFTGCSIGFGIMGSSLCRVLLQLCIPWENYLSYTYVCLSPSSIIWCWPNNWEVSRQTMSMVSQCKLVSGSGLLERRSAPLIGQRGSGGLYLYPYVTCRHNNVRKSPYRRSLPSWTTQCASSVTYRSWRRANYWAASNVGETDYCDR